MSAELPRTDDGRETRLNRRELLKAGGLLAAAVGFPTIVPSSVFGQHAPSNRITMASIGPGRMGTWDVIEVLAFADVQFVAACDVDRKRLENARNTIESHYARRSGSGCYKGCFATTDFREIIARDDLDAVMVTTPDHWHALPALAAARAGKDLFVQKPLTLTIPEGRALSDAARRRGVVVQVGSQQRSARDFRRACELVRNGRIGRLQTIRIELPGDQGGPLAAPTPPPAHLDYDLWLGPAPWRDYVEQRVMPREGYDRPGWLRAEDYTNGMITNWGVHHVDIAHWAMGCELGGPAEVEAKAERLSGGVWDVHGDFEVTYRYADGVTVIVAGNEKCSEGVRFEGSEGWVRVTRFGMHAEPASLLTSRIGPEELHLYESNHHKRNWVDCIRSRRETAAPVEVGHRANSACILGWIAMKLNRRLQWDAERERFLGDEEANRLLHRPMREPWHGRA
ncbi:MAG TPA: Gfo/Idh/MocA family oxidoreductase [Candidatus Sumerlaeota bacterium]|nr:Gfo/Idh/MocA family oxidoreductase [Candidatus Sumerlaeota bacterium]